MPKLEAFFDFVWPWRVIARQNAAMGRHVAINTKLSGEVSALTARAQELGERLRQCDRENRKLVGMVDYDGRIRTLEAFGDHAVFKLRVEVTEDVVRAERIVRVAIHPSNPLYMVEPFDDEELRQKWPYSRDNLARRFCELMVPRLYDDLGASLIASLNAVRK